QAVHDAGMIACFSLSLWRAPQSVAGRDSSTALAPEPMVARSFNRPPQAPALPHEARARPVSTTPRPRRRPIAPPAAPLSILAPADERREGAARDPSRDRRG